MSDERTASGLIHHGYTPPPGFAAPQPAVHKASTVIFPDVAALRARDWRHKNGYTYGLHGTPTTFTLEARIATLMHAEHCVLAPSGLAAISLVDLALLKAGDELLLPANVYGPSRDLARGLLARLGITHRLYDPQRPETLAAAIGPQTKLVWLEAPGSVTMEFPDLPALVAACRHAPGGPVRTAIDDTWGSGLAFDAFALGIDVVMQALTKYPSGGGDVLMGAVCTRDATLHEQILLAHMQLGLGVGANDAEAVLRGLPSLVLRYDAQDTTARTLAGWLQTQPGVARVLHPALDGAPGHAHWRALCAADAGRPQGRAAGLFSVLLDAGYTRRQVDGFVDALRLFSIGYSWAGPKSLVVPYDLPAMRPGDERLQGHLVRFSVGLEEAAALQDDLAQALARLGAPTRG